jgi:AraC family transcriptional regulator
MTDLIIHEYTYRPHQHLARHHHSAASLSLMLDGSQLEIVGRRRYDCPTWSAVLKGADVEHENRVGPRRTRGLFVQLSPAITDTLSRSASAPLGAVCFADVVTRGLVRRMAVELRRGHSDTELVVESLVLELLETITRTRARWGSNGTDAWCRRAVEYLEANYRRRFRVADVAAACGINPSHLAEVFRRKYAVSVGEWVRNRRLDFARDALLATTHSISAIAFSAGFADQSHLTRLFRARFRMTPAEFRRSQTRQSF